MGTTNILDLNNRLEKVEKNVAPNSYTSLKNKPKINNVILTGNKSLSDIGAAAAADLGELTDLTTTDKSSCVGAINEVNGNGLTYGIYEVNDATDIKDFIKKLITQAHSDLATKKANTLYNILAAYSGSDYFYGTLERQYTARYAFSLGGTSGDNIYRGYYDISSDNMKVFRFDGTVI